MDRILLKPWEAPELSPPRMKQEQAGLGFLGSRMGPQWGVKVRFRPLC